MSAHNMCDQCREREWVRSVRIPRPSDPHDLACILVLCDVCAPKSGDTVRTEAEWDDYMEGEPGALWDGRTAVQNKHYWLT